MFPYGPFPAPQVPTFSYSFSTAKLTQAVDSTSLSVRSRTLLSCAAGSYFFLLRFQQSGHHEIGVGGRQLGSYRVQDYLTNLAEPLPEMLRFHGARVMCFSAVAFTVSQLR